MSSQARKNYLEAEVLTATPQKLQLMLIETAMRYITLTKERWRSDDDEQAVESLIRAQRIVTEMLGSLNKDIDPELTKNVATIYLFVFRSLTEAYNSRNEQKLDDALAVLEIERDTWRQVCRQLGGTGPAGGSYSPAPQPESPGLPNLSPDTGPFDHISGGFSLEA